MNTGQPSSSIASDPHSLNSIREQGLTDKKAAIKRAAKEFEAFFMNMMLKSMRQASDVIGDDSMLSSSQEKMFVGMLDEQMSVELSQKGNLGIADLLVRDLLGENKNSVAKFDKIDSLSQTSNPAAHSSVAIEPPTVPVVAHYKESNKSQLDGGGKATMPIMQPVEKTAKKIEMENRPEKSVRLAEKKSLFANMSDFVQRLLPIAKTVAGKIGVDPKILLAQAALETGWGQYIMHDEKGKPSHNLFGIKSHNLWSGESVKIDTLEVEKGSVVRRKDQFRMYDSFEQSFDDFINFIQNNPRYQKTLKSVNNAKQFISELQDAGYATDPNYASKVISIFERMPASDIPLEQGK